MKDLNQLNKDYIIINEQATLKSQPWNQQIKLISKKSNNQSFNKIIYRQKSRPLKLNT